MTRIFLTLSIVSLVVIACDCSQSIIIPFNSTGFHVSNFKWSTKCTNDKNPLGTIEDISLQPDPVNIPGQVSLHFAGQLNRAIKSPTPLHLRIYKKVAFFWVKVPCQSPDSLGSCDYDDFCNKWPIPRDAQGQCPEAYVKAGIPCQCPFEAKHYNLPQSVLGDIKDLSNIPKWLEKGDYRVQAWLAEPDNEYGLCFELNLTLKPS